MLTYQDYLNHARRYEGSEGGSEPMSEARWNALDDKAKWGMVDNSLSLTPDDPRYAGLKKQVGGEPDRIIHISTAPLADGDLGDPSRQVKGEGWFAHSEDNQTPEYQDRIGLSGNILNMFLATAAAIAGGAALSGAFGAPATSALGAAPGQGFGTIGYQGAAGIAEAATGATAAATPTSPSSPPPASTPAPSTPPPAAAPTATGAPVVDSVAAVPGTNNGIINNAIAQGRNAVSAASGWYNNLSPASRLILGNVVSHGANALISANAQRNAQEAADEREEEQRQDRIRRGSVPDFSHAFKPRKPGIIDGLRIPRPGGS